MAHILFVSYFFAPDGLSTAVLMAELAQSLQAEGHQITVVTTTPHYNFEPEAAARQPLRKRWGHWLQESDLQGVRVLHVKVAPKGSRIWLRALDYVRYHSVGTLAEYMLVRSPDLIFAPSPPLTVGVQAWLMGLLHRAPFIYNVQEVYPDVAIKLGLLRSRGLIWLMAQMERFVYRHAARVSVISEWFRRALVVKGVSPEQIVVIPNFVDTDALQPGVRLNPFSAKHGLDAAFTVLYAGNIGLTQGFETILEAARQLDDRLDLRFAIVGGGARRDWLEQKLNEWSIKNVTMLPYQPRSSVPDIYASGDLCLVPLKRDMAQDTFPSKVYSIMAAGRAVLAAADADSELAWLVREADCGWVVPPGDASALAAAIEHARANHQELSEKGRRGRQYVVAHHSRHAVVQQYVQLIDEILG